MPINPLGNTYSEDITEDLLYDITRSRTSTEFTPTDIAYDISINNLPFVISANNQNKYQRETAQYKKDQFDNSAEPGEQSLLGWWLRSQTSFHNGAGIKFYEPGTDYQHVSHRFNDSRGVDVWTIGEATLLNEVFHSYTGANGIIAVAGESATGVDYIVSGDSAGVLKKITLNGDSAPATPTNYTLAAGHVSGGSTPNLFKSITSDGTRYFAVCNAAIHVGNIDGTGSDIVIARHATGGIHAIKYAKGHLMFGEAENLYYIPVANPLVSINHGGSANAFPAGTTNTTHINPDFFWNVIEGGNKFIYAAGYAGSDSEIWAVPFDETSLLPDPASAIQVVQLPYGEIVKAMQFYLGYMAIGTNRGIRIAQVANDGSLTLGPLLVETQFPVTGFVSNGNYIWASTAVAGDNGNDNAILIRIDLSTQFDDGTFAYAYDLQYQSDEDSYASDVLFAQDRLHIIVNEGGTAGEIKTQKLSENRTSGWLKTGTIRYGTIEPKFFKFLKVIGRVQEGDTITITTIDSAGNEFNLVSLDSLSIGAELEIAQPAIATDQIALKFTLTNGSPNSTLPVLESYQLKSLPATRRQRLIQYPLSCYDNEMDRFNTTFGYSNRASDMLEALELLEESADFVRVRDYRTNELYTGIIEEVRFSNESSPDKDSSGFGGLLLVTVRKI